MFDGDSSIFTCLPAIVIKKCCESVAPTSQHCPSGSTQDFLGSAPMRAVPIWWAENTVMPFFLMPAQAMQASAMHYKLAQAACAIFWHCICLGEQ